MARPRDADIDRRLLEATGQLLVDVGYDELTMEAVATAAEVSKPSLYRRYPSKAHLVFEYLIAQGIRDRLPDTGSFRDDMVQVALRQAGSVAQSAALVADQTAQMAHDPAFAEAVLERYVLVIVRHQLEVWRRGVARHEVSEALDGADALRDLSAALWIRFGALHEPITEASVARVVDRWIAGVGDRSGQPNRYEL